MDDMVLVSRAVLRDIEQDVLSLDDSLNNPIPGITTTEGITQFVFRIAKRLCDLYDTAPRITTPRADTRTLTLMVAEMESLAEWLDHTRDGYDKPNGSPEFAEWDARNEADGTYANYHELTALWEKVQNAL